MQEARALLSSRQPAGTSLVSMPACLTAQLQVRCERTLPSHLQERWTASCINPLSEPTVCPGSTKNPMDPTATLGQACRRLTGTSSLQSIRRKGSPEEPLVGPWRPTFCSARRGNFSQLQGRIKVSQWPPMIAVPALYPGAFRVHSFPQCVSLQGAPSGSMHVAESPCGEVPSGLAAAPLSCPRLCFVQRQRRPSGSI